MRTNNDSVRNQDLEVEANFSILSNKEWKWNVGANLTFVKSKILKLLANGQEQNRQNGIQVHTGNSSKDLKWVDGYAEGERYGDIYGYRMTHIIQNEADLQNYANYVD